MVTRKPSSLCFLDGGFFDERKGEKMYTLGVVLFLVASVMIFGSDILAKRGKIKGMLGLFKAKMSGIAVLILGLVFMLLGK